jgi:hypothetical protein
LPKGNFLGIGLYFDVIAELYSAIIQSIKPNTISHARFFYPVLLITKKAVFCGVFTGIK